MREKTPTHNGILNINKPTGWTSHDVVAKVRRLLGQREVGHAGTLDPLATGVLLVCAGEATRVSEYLMAGQKVYRAVARLGVTTDTYDIDGQITAEKPIPRLTRQDVRRALDRFVGAIQQMPPAFSAIKKDGVPAYQRARKGQEVELAARPVTIHRIELLEFQSPHVTIEVVCDPGTYIRSLTHDMGQVLGCGAVLIQLTRLRSGQFTVEDANDLETLAEAARTGELARHLHPLRAALYDLTPVSIDAAASQRLMHGQTIPCSVTPKMDTGYALEFDGTVRAILTYDAATNLWRPHKVFATDDGGRISAAPCLLSPVS
ncbi:MAG: tRNA pseudouridine(55) synthase TruB [Chloroflexi bacterium]|nr:tRNA pseudouridine(55) synthase TruB [Chloroflexota bacterium]